MKLPWPDPNHFFAALVVTALAVSVFFQGFEIIVFTVTMTLVLGMLTLSLWQGKNTGHVLPSGWLPVALTLFWLWLGTTIFWSVVPYVSVLDFWWIGALPIAFWSWLLLPEADRDRAWRWLEWGALGFGLAMAVTGLVQLLIFSRPPAATFLNINSYASLLILIALPVAARILWLRTAGRQRQGWWLTMGLAVLVLALALTRGRAASVSFLAGFLLLVLAAWKTVPRTVILQLVAIVSAVYVGAFLSAPQQYGERFAELYTPFSAGSMVERLDIWAATWRMIGDAPWWGAGTGVFSLAYPAYRSMTESSAGFLVHNDYLQLWYEAGLPGLLLLIGTLLVVAYRFFRTLHVPDLDVRPRIEIAGLFAGLFVIAFHAVVDFPFHVLTILILAGLMLARFHVLTGRALGSRMFNFRPAPFLRAGVYKLIMTLLMLFPLVYLASIAAAVTEAGRAQTLAREGRLDDADQAYARAYRFYPYADNVLVNHADLYRHSLTLLPRDQLEKRRMLYARAMTWLDRAEQLNPLRSLNSLVRADLILANQDLTGGQSPEIAERAFQRALSLNPRFFHARYAYARFLAQGGRQREAHALLEEGMRHSRPSHEDTVPFYLLVRHYREARGDKNGVMEINRLIEGALLASGWRRVERPENAGPLKLPADKRP